jgi:hypothetical protein
MVGGIRNEKPPKIGRFSRNRPKSAKLHDKMTSTSTGYQIHSEARGPHWIAWITRGGETKPDRSIVLIAANQKEAEERARRWAEQSEY